LGRISKFSLDSHGWPPGLVFGNVSTWVFPKIGVLQNGWFIVENPIKLEDLGVQPFKETSTYSSVHVFASHDEE